METKESTRESIELIRLEREKLMLAQQKKEFEETGKVAFRSDDKSEIEFQRYKQDCRKRALDLAHSEYGDWYREANSKSATNNIGEKPDVENLAEKYYQWLITIPQ